MVVIGGGSLGCQTVYHLAKMGTSNVLLLERDRLTAGTTWHTAGQPSSTPSRLLPTVGLALALASAANAQSGSC